MHLVRNVSRSLVTCALILFALLLLCVQSALAAPRLRIAIQENSAPKYAEKLESDGDIHGICPDILRAIERQDPTLRFEFESSVQPLRRIEHSMSVAHSDANCLADNAERRAKFNVDPHAIFSFNYHLIARTEDPVNVTNWDDVRSLGNSGKILVVSGSGVLERLHGLGGLSVEESGKSATANLKKLVMGRGRFFYYRTHDWQRQIQAAGVGGQVRILPARLEVVRFHLMFGRHVDRSVIASVSRAVQMLEADGTMAKLRAKWQLLEVPIRFGGYQRFSIDRSSVATPLPR